MKYFVVFVSALVLSACASVAVMATKEDVTWEYISTRCEPVKLHNLINEGNQIVLPVEIVSRMDSAICMYNPEGYVKDQRIYIKVKRAVCGVKTEWPLKVMLPALEYGTYAVHYDDQQANNPVIGTVRFYAKK